MYPALLTTERYVSISVQYKSHPHSIPLTKIYVFLIKKVGHFCRFSSLFTLMCILDAPFVQAKLGLLNSRHRTSRPLPIPLPVASHRRFRGVRTTICANLPLSVLRLSSSHAEWLAYWCRYFGDTPWCRSSIILRRRLKKRSRVSRSYVGLRSRGRLWAGCRGR